MAVKPLPDGYPRVSPYLIVDDAAKAIDFYTQVLGGIERMRMPAPEGRVGHAEILCTFTKSTQAEPFSAFALCTGGFFLPAGQVLIEGFIRFTDEPANFRIPVVGGTGAYANARGYAHVRDIGPQDTDNSNIEFHLLP